MGITTTYPLASFLLEGLRWFLAFISLRQYLRKSKFRAMHPMRMRTRIGQRSPGDHPSTKSRRSWATAYNCYHRFRLGRKPFGKLDKLAPEARGGVRGLLTLHCPKNTEKMNE